MGAKPSKDQLLYEQVKCGNVKGIKALHREGAGVEWTDKEGKTPLILACTTHNSLKVVRVLIKLGANVDARSPGNSAGTPLHHAAQRGIVETVELLLKRGANPLLVNDGWKIPLDLARTNNHLSVVRLLEKRICLFDGWLMKFYGLRILEPIINPRWTSTKIWAVILPCDLHTHAKHFKLAIYSDLQAVQPNPVIQLWEVQITEPDFNQPDPALVIVDKAKNKRYEFLSENEGDKEQLQLLRDACKGIRQHNTYVPTTPAFTPMPSVPLSSPHANQLDTPIGSTSAQQAPPMVSLPSAPPIVEETFYRYPSIDSSPVELTIPTRVVQPSTNVANEGGSTGSCVICLNAPAEVACVPCGHKAGCMSCLQDIEARGGGCPICRANIGQVMRVYNVS